MTKKGKNDSIMKGNDTKQLLSLLKIMKKHGVESVSMGDISIKLFPLPEKKRRTAKIKEEPKQKTFLTDEEVDKKRREEEDELLFHSAT